MKAHSRNQTNRSLPPSLTTGRSGILQRKCASCENHTVAGDKCDKCKNGVLQQKSSNNSDRPEVPPIVHEVLSSSGRPLDKTTRSFFESRFAHNFSKVPISSVSQQMSHSRLTIGEPTDVYEQEADRVANSVMLKEKHENKSLPANERQDAKFDLSHVRIHTDSRAAESARAVNAMAYTVGNNIVFGAGQFAPETYQGQQLIAHELTHVMQQTRAEKSHNGQAPANSNGGILHTLLQRWSVPQWGQTNQTGTAESAPEYTKPGWTRENKLGIVRVEEAGSKQSGARLRGSPEIKSGNVIFHLEENTRVFILAKNAATKWLYIVVDNKQYKGSTGYVAGQLIWSGLPDPDAVTYYNAEPGFGLQKLVEYHPQYADYDIRTGDDARSIVMAVIVANAETGGVKINQEKWEEASNPGTIEGLKDKADEYRRVLRPILQSVELIKDKKIWLPGKGYIQALKSKGVIPTRAGWKNTLIAAGKGIGGFLAGLGEGFVMSIADVFIGIYDMIKSVISLVQSLVSGEAIKAAEEFYDTVKDMSAAELFTKLKDALVKMVTSAVDDFSRKWNADNTYNRWNFRGYVIGYILAEIVMIIFTAGSATVVKWLGKLGKLGSKIAKILLKVFDKVDDVRDKVPGRKSRKKTGDVDHKDSKKIKDDNDSKARQKAEARVLAGSIAATHDARDDSTTVALFSLNALKARYKWISRFGKKKVSPGHFQILMYSSPGEVIYPDYTPKKDEEDDKSQQVKEESEEAPKKQEATAAEKFKWGNPLSKPTYGHTFLDHTKKLKPSKLIDRARSLGHQVGQWLDDNAAARFIADIAKKGEGVYDVPLSGVKGRSFLPDGKELVSDMARVIVKPDGSVRTAFPYNSAHPS